MTQLDELFISIDIEASGPTPGLYSMLSLGACLVEDPSQSFYIEVQPINDAFTDEAMSVHGLSLETLKRAGTPPLVAMGRFSAWVAEAASGGRRPVMVGYNVPFDWAFVNYYSHRYLGKNPLGHAALDIKAFYMGLTGTAWAGTGKSSLPILYYDGQSMSHNALDDARLQGSIFRLMLADARKESQK